MFPRPVPRMMQGMALRGRLSVDEQDEYRRPVNEDDDGYDPYSDRPAEELRYEEDPWR